LRSSTGDREDHLRPVRGSLGEGDRGWQGFDSSIAAYYQILEDCLIAERIEPLTASATRKKLTRSNKYLCFLNEHPTAGRGYVVCRAPRKAKLGVRVQALPWQELPAALAG